MQTVLVAGGAGFIGSHLCKSLLSENYKVICVDNLITGDKGNILDLQENENFSFLEKDITKPLDDIKADFIFHLASPASPNEKSPKSYRNLPLETLLANSLGTYNLLELAKKTGAKFLFASTSEVYGDPKVSPQAEDYFGNVNPNGVRSVYDESKRFGEAITMSYVRTSGLDARIIRIFNTYGPLMRKDDGRAVSEFIIQALANQSLTVYGDGKQTRSFCYVDDMAIGIEKAMFSDNIKGEVINLGNPDEKTILDLAEIIKKISGSTSQLVFEPLPEDDPKIRKPDISKAKRLLDWEPKVGIEEGIEKTVQYFKGLI
ncbi:MAG TPA: UDP-glucuronic acid decarboxylase family protein [Patescibacteria group bacterium]|jgi:nucleoside-diphosphate-sugar epimerase|nr:UDP-glucuronic acid decarboxylase family protein [Patescibacteria group bacterium]